MQASSDDVVSRLQLQLAAIGYDVKQSGVMDNATKAALVAFQRRFRPDDIGGAADDDTQMLVAAVARLVRRT
jgi:N-acetyl-anhydromuramyl-L-alanine amidase AmpD